jgi:ribosomal protein L40E
MSALMDMAAKAPPSSHRTCKNCGAHMSTDAKSCQSCGTSWEAAAKAPPGANAPYKIQKRGGKFVVLNNTGEVKSTFDSHDKALSYMRALYVSVPGAAKRADRVKFSGKAKTRIPKPTTY